MSVHLTTEIQNEDAKIKRQTKQNKIQKPKTDGTERRNRLVHNYHWRCQLYVDRVRDRKNKKTISKNKVDLRSDDTCGTFHPTIGEYIRIIKQNSENLQVEIFLS